MTDPTSRFTGLAERYARCRPTYPDSARDYIVELASLGPRSVVADVGCGTGISSRLLAACGIPVIGIEPNAEMREAAEREPIPPGSASPVYRDGRGEVTGLADGEVDAVLAAQAFHWFDASAALREMFRILRPGGWVFLMWNERDESDAFTRAYGDVVRTAPDAAVLEGSRARAGEVLLRAPLFESARRVVFTHAQAVDEEGLVGRALSASYAPKEPAALDAFVAALRAVATQYARDGIVRIRYETSVYAAQKPA